MTPVVKKYKSGILALMCLNGTGVEDKRFSASRAELTSELTSLWNEMTEEEIQQCEDFVKRTSDIIENVLINN